MSIKKAKQDENQTELNLESREDRLARLFEIDSKIQELESEMEQHKAVVSGFKDQIKEVKEDQKRLVNQLKCGQETIAVTVSEEEGENEESEESTEEGDE